MQNCVALRVDKLMPAWWINLPRVLSKLSHFLEKFRGTFLSQDVRIRTWASAEKFPEGQNHPHVKKSTIFSTKRKQNCSNFRDVFTVVLWWHKKSIFFARERNDCVPSESFAFRHDKFAFRCKQLGVTKVQHYFVCTKHLHLSIVVRLSLF